MSATHEPICCTNCGRRIKSTVVWLEFNSHTNSFVLPGAQVPSDDSQGGFPLGPDCAKKIIRALKAGELVAAV